ncbi:hypothetical protein [uncultured Methylobacterium sp.]|uniref:hypothetical protein n=1 Tax=uncultured Methylobacterium sp. TaxID=157278 RepID=UPI0035CBC839
MEMLRLAAKKSQRVVRGYKPAEKLAALGLVEIAIAEGAFAWVVKATPAGRAALALQTRDAPDARGEGDRNADR